MKNIRHMALGIILLLMVTSLIGCASNESTVSSNSTNNTVSENTDTETTDTSTVSTVATSNSDIFTDRDMEQEADLTDATALAVTSGSDLTITEEGIYVISGTATDCTIIVEAADSAKIQLVLDSASITNTDAPAIYVKEADKVFVTSTNSTNSFSVTGTYVADGDTNLDAVIFSKSDLVLNGLGSLEINSPNGNGISCKDDLKVTGGTYSITASGDGIESNDSISICDGTFTIVSLKDAIHCEYDDDTTVGSVYISGGTFSIDATDDGIQATTIAQVEAGTINITKCSEGIEGTYVLINDGTINIASSDDGINATNKSTAFDVLLEINGGDITVVMESGDTDALDSNGDIEINGGNINITAQMSAFDYNGTGTINGGTVIVNGSQVSEMSAMSMGGAGNKGGGKKFK